MKDRYIAAALIAASTQAIAAEEYKPLIGGNNPEATVYYKVDGAQTEFFARLPAGWSFTIAVDGDQNSVWGTGPRRASTKLVDTADHKFGQDNRGSVYCAQIIVAAMPDDPDQWALSTDCNGYPSKGHVELGQLDQAKMATIRYKIPTEEVFGLFNEAHLQVCIWDTKVYSCLATLKRPLVISRNQ